MAFPGRVAPYTLRFADIENAPVRQGNGGKDRYTLLAARMLERYSTTGATASVVIS